MILPRGAVAPLALLVALATTSVGYYAGIADAPRAFIGGGDDLLIAPPAGEIPGRAVVPTALVGPLRGLGSVRSVSPEVYALTQVEGRSVLVRGVEVAAFLAIEQAELVEGRLPANDGEALIGRGLQRALRIQLGDDVLVPSPFRRHAALFSVVGVIDAETPARDELIITLPAGRSLADVDDGQAHLVRIDADPPDEVRGLLHASAPVFTYSDVQLATSTFLSGEPVTLTAKLTNWGRFPAVKDVEVRQGGDVVGRSTYVVPGLSTIPVAVGFTLTGIGDTRITLNPTLPVTLRAPTHRIEAATTVVAGNATILRVRDLEGSPVPGIVLTTEGANATTNEMGEANLRFPTAGHALVLAKAGEETTATTRVFVVRPEFADAPSLAVLRVERDPALVSANGSVQLRLEIQNVGGVEGHVPVGILLDGQLIVRHAPRLAPGQTGEVLTSIPRIDAGRHTVGVEDTKIRYRFTAYEGRDPRVSALFDQGWEGDAEGGGEGGGGAAADPIPLVDEKVAEDVIDRLLGNVRLAVTILIIATGVLVFTASLAVLSRHLAERSTSVGILKALGAPDEYVLRIATREALVKGTLAAILGVAGGSALAYALGTLGIVRAFGHEVEPVFTWNAMVLIVILAALLIAIATRSIVSGAMRVAPDKLVRGELKRGRGRDLHDLGDIVDGAP